MTQRIKALGLALVALAALGVLVASAAQAARLDVPGREKAVIRAEREGTEPHTLSIPGVEPIRCTAASLEGTLQQAPEIKELKDVTLTAAYSECTAFGFAAQVHMNGCKYTATGESNGVDPALTGWVDVTGCTTGKRIEILVDTPEHFLLCTVTIPEQNTLSHLLFNDVQGSSPTHARVQATIAGIAWEQDGVFCPRGDKAHGQDASFTGATTITAWEDKGSSGLDVPGKERAVIRGEIQNSLEPHRFTIPGDEAIKCTVANLEGTIQRGPEIKELAEGTLTGTYSGCQTGGRAVTVDMNGCKYTITGESEGIRPALTAWVDITGCTTGKDIEITIPELSCTIRIPEQNTLSHVVFADVGGSSPRHVRVQATVSNITWQQQGSSCPRGDKAQGQDAEFTGSTTLKAFEDLGSGVQETENGHQFTTLNEGPQIALEVTPDDSVPVALNVT
jgi:hypothetical protein